LEITAKFPASKFDEPIAERPIMLNLIHAEHLSQKRIPAARAEAASETKRNAEEEDQEEA